MSTDGAAVGLAFLDTVIRQNHVRRLTERLTLVEHRAARCTTEMDISLGMLDGGQREAGVMYQRLRNGGDRRDLGLDTDPETSPATSDVIWVPVSKVPRRSHSPIDVTNAEGAKLPRLTQYETSRLMASALYRLLRVILLTHPDARRDDGSPLQDFLFRKDKPRWLLQAAMAAMLTERSKPMSALPRRADTPGTVRGEPAGHREEALRILSSYESTLREYSTLLNIAVSDYLLVVALDTSRDEHLLAYDTPLHVVEEKAPEPSYHPLRRSGGGYLAEYRTSLPASLRAYHLVAETEPGLQISKMYLTSNADSSIVTSLRGDLMTLSARVEAEHRKPTGQSGQKILELELQTCLRQLSELLRRRRWEASHGSLPLPDDILPSTCELAWANSSGEAVETESGEASSSLFRHPLVTSEKLGRAADEIQAAEMHRDLNVENDPASARAHVYWRRDPSRLNLDRSIEITTSIYLRDTSGSRPRSVIAYVFSVVGISYVLGCIMFSSPFPYVGEGPVETAADADAIIAVLLLVPGFLYTRLKLPARQSIAGKLRTLPRFVAHVTIGSAALLAAAIATSGDPNLIRTFLAVSAVVPIVAMLVMLVVPRIVRTDLLATDTRLPAWARTRAHARRRRWRWLPTKLRDLYSRPDVVFRTSDGMHDDQH